MITLLVSAGLIIGNFVTTAEACVLPPQTMTSPEYIASERRTFSHRVSRRTLRNDVRKTWNR